MFGNPVCVELCSHEMVFGTIYDSSFTKWSNFLAKKALEQTDKKAIRPSRSHLTPWTCWAAQWPMLAGVGRRRAALERWPRVCGGTTMVGFFSGWRPASRADEGGGRQRRGLGTAELVHGLGAAELCVEALVRYAGGRAGWRLTGEEMGGNEKKKRWGWGSGGWHGACTVFCGMSSARTCSEA
jgi:hypothetical protein